VSWPGVVGGLLVSVAAAAGCARPAVDPLQLSENRLIVFNQTPDQWTDVAIWLNTYYRVTAPFIAAGGRFEIPLDTFVAGYGQRFDGKHTQVNALRLTATLPNGRSFELKKTFAAGGLAGALGGKT
jgi:hypothetical protein